MKKIIKSIIAILFLVLSIALIFYIKKLGIIPNKYIIIGSIVLIVLNLVAAILLFSKKIIPKIFSILLYILIAFSLVAGFHVVHTTDNFLDKAFNNVQKELTLTYYVISPNEHKEEDLKEKEIYYLDNTEYVKDALTNLNDKFKPTMTPSMDIEDIIKQEFFMLDTNTINLLTEEANFDIEKYHIIYTIDLTYTIEEEPVETNTDKHYYNIFVGGHDFSGTRMDMNKIITVNTDTNEVLITNIHRFAYLDVPGYNKKNTLSLMGMYGVKNNITSLEQLLDIKFDYYLVADATSLPTLIDDIGGIEYCSEKAYTTFHTTTLDYKDNKGYRVHVKKGCQHLNGIEALTVARERLAFKDGAWERDKNTTDIMIDILDAMKKPSNITNLNTILNDVNGLYTTSIPRDVITTGAKKLLNSKIKIEQYSIDGWGGIDKVNFSNSKETVFYLSDDSTKEAKEKIHALDK